MNLDLADYSRLTRIGVQQFWAGRSDALENSEQSQGGERSAVLAGKNLDDFLTLIEYLIRKNGLPYAQIHVASRPFMTLPGYYRPTKIWDVVAIDSGRLVAAVELKSQVGPSFGNNFNNRTEEAIGTAVDLQTAIRDGALGYQPQPFLGWLILVEDCEKSRRPVRDRSPHFPVFPEFQGASYLQRYDVLCQRMMREGLYTSATVLASPRTAAVSGNYGVMSQMTSMQAFAAKLASHAAGWSQAYSL